jgi:hypothetical protein
MKWLLTIPTRSFDIVRAFTIGNIVEYRQTDNFRVGDDVFIVLASEEVSYQVKYVCKVEKINIDVEDSQYYHHYVNEDGELELIDFLMQLKLIQTIPDENVRRIRDTKIWIRVSALKTQYVRSAKTGFILTS